MRHQPGSHQHGNWVIGLDTRTRLLGTVNLAVSLNGRICGWGTCDRPRRTFVGHHRLNTKEGEHFIRLKLSNWASIKPVWVRQISLDKDSWPKETPA